MAKDMPPPVTRDSSKVALWEGLTAAREEIDAQQLELDNQARRICKAEADADTLRYQLDIIRSVLKGEVKA